MNTEKIHGRLDVLELVKAKIKSKSQNPITIDIVQRFCQFLVEGN